MNMQISPLSAAKHYAAAAEFWERQAKALQAELDTVESAAVQLRDMIKRGDSQELADAKTHMLAAEKPVAD